MTPGRLEAFSDAVIAIVITIMVLDLRVPHGVHLRALRPLVPVFLTYVLSFVFLGIYWNNHHHLLQRTETVTGGTLWANLSLLFWLSLFPFATAWMGENHFATTPTAFYGVVLLCAAIAYFVLQTVICRETGTGFGTRPGTGPRLEGEGFASAVRRGHRARVPQSLDRAGYLHRRRGPVARAGPSPRTRFRRDLKCQHSGELAPYAHALVR
jgi:hypothetical protein